MTKLIDKMTEEELPKERPPEFGLPRGVKPNIKTDRWGDKYHLTWTRDIGKIDSIACIGFREKNSKPICYFYDKSGKSTWDVDPNQLTTLDSVEIEGLGGLLKKMKCEYRDYDRDPYKMQWERIVCRPTVF